MDVDDFASKFYTTITYNSRSNNFKEPNAFDNVLTNVENACMYVCYHKHFELRIVTTCARNNAVRQQPEIVFNVLFSLSQVVIHI